MSIQPTDFVCDLAIRNRNAIPLFERLGIDYCCSGQRPLAEVCAESGLDAGSIIEELSRTTESAQLADLFELLTHEHIHIENNILFPRSVELESHALRLVQS